MLPGTSVLSISLSCKQMTRDQACASWEAPTMASSIQVQVWLPAPIYCIKHGEAHRMAEKDRHVRHGTLQGMHTRVLKSLARGK